TLFGAQRGCYLATVNPCEDRALRTLGEAAWIDIRCSEIRRPRRQPRSPLAFEFVGGMMDRRNFIIGAAAAMALGPARAQEPYPSHGITIINAFPPGGANDIVTRPLAAAMEAVLKQPVVVETKAGAGGQVGAQVAATARPDGYTLLSHNTGISGYAEVD